MANETPRAENPPPTSSTKSDQLPANIDKTLTAVEARLAPASREMIQKMLTVIAVTLQLEIPTNEALRVYLHLFEKYPEDLLRHAGECILKEHHYPRFPFPADFIKHIDQHYEDRLENLRWWKRTANFHRRGIVTRSEGRAGHGPRLLGEFLKTPEK